MGLSESRHGPLTVIDSRWRLLRVATPHPYRASQALKRRGSSADLSLRAAPSHPGKSGDCFYPLLHRRSQASSDQADWPLPSRNEAETGSLAPRLTGSPFEASPNGLLRSTLDWLHVEWVIHMVSSFHLTRPARLGLAHLMNADKQPTCYPRSSAFISGQSCKPREPSYSKPGTVRPGIQTSSTSTSFI